MENKKKFIAVGIAALMILVIVALLIHFSGGESGPGKATLNDLLSSQSVRTDLNGSLVVSDASGFYALMATPAACYYSSDGQRSVSPLLAEHVQINTKTNNLLRFLDAYPKSEVVTVGDIQTPSLKATKAIGGGDLETTSLNLAQAYWTSSDGAVLVRSDKAGYAMGVVVAPLASYVDIPIIVADSLDSNVRDTLSGLGVKYTITCGDIDGYKKVMAFSTVEEALDMTTTFVRHPDGLNSNISYVTLANPMDAFAPKVVKTVAADGSPFAGSVWHMYTGPDTAYSGLEQSTAGDDWEVNVPEDMTNVIMNVKLEYKPHPQDEVDGERIYVFVRYFDPALGGDQYTEIYYFGTAGGQKENDLETVDFDIPLYGATGKFVLHVEGRNTYEAGNGGIVTKEEIPYKMTVRIDSYESPVFSFMPGISSLAPYLSAYHCGLVLAKPSYAMQYDYISNPAAAREPAVFKDADQNASDAAVRVHNDLITLLGRLIGYDSIVCNKDTINAVADYYYENPIPVAICADTNMIPWYYHPGDTMGPEEGYNQPGDVIYGDINIDTEDGACDLGPGRIQEDVMDLELPVGRMTGWDVQDASALISRTIFYYDIIDSFVGHSKDPDKVWKNNAYAFLGSKLPVETMYGTLINTVKEYAQEGGFTTVEHTSEELSDIKFTAQIQEGSNYILGGVHGNYYWYVPQCHNKATSGGSAYDVSNVNELSYGPSTMYLVSCITGRIDGMAARSCLSMTYVHVGVNAYVGASRSTLGTITPDLDFDMRAFEPEGAVLLGEIFTQHLIVQDQTVGMALRDAKNEYLVHDLSGGSITTESYIMFQHYICYGDPAFNPYEPANA